MMNKRLIWNFEINTKVCLNLPSPEETTAALHWETRFFWPESAIIPLSGLDKGFLSLAHYQIKAKPDVYFLLPEMNYNIKRRRETMVYKPLLKRSESAFGFGKKIKLDENIDQELPTAESGPIHSNWLFQQLQANTKQVTVDKEALIYRFPSLPDTKLELARLIIDETVFFSASIESSALNIVNSLAKQLVNHQDSCDYITFLKAHCPC